MTPLVQQLIVVAVVLAAAAWLGRRLAKRLAIARKPTQPGCGDDCGCGDG